MIISQLLPSQIKIFTDYKVCPSNSIKIIRSMKNEPISFQIAFRADVIGEYIPVSVSASSELPISAYKMVNLPVTRSVTF